MNVTATTMIHKVPLKTWIEDNCIPITECGCWIWMRHVCPVTGYGKLQISRTTLLAHRTSWQVFRGAIPPGLLVLHRCDIRCCLNPDHLFLGTYTDNARDRSQKGRSASRKGANNNNAKLTDNDVRDIRSSSLSNRDLGIKYNLMARSVWAIRQGIGWRHVS